MYSTRPYPSYESSANLLKKLKVNEDFVSDGPIRYAHRNLDGMEIYFISNRTGQQREANCSFRVAAGSPELWNPLTGETRALPNFTQKEGFTHVPINFDAWQSFFVVFNKNQLVPPAQLIGTSNFPTEKIVSTLEGPWKVAFDPKWGGPAEVIFDQLTDWTNRPEEGIKYYSGTATYRKSFRLPTAVLAEKKSRALSLGEVNCMAQVWLNGQELGTLWTAPWVLDITRAVRPGENLLEVKVVNLWPNRLTGDEQYPSDGIKNRQWPDWLLENKPRNTRRITFASYSFYKRNSPLLKSGLLGPVRILQED